MPKEGKTLETAVAPAMPQTLEAEILKQLYEAKEEAQEASRKLERVMTTYKQYKAKVDEFVSLFEINDDGTYLRCRYGEDRWDTQLLCRVDEAAFRKMNEFLNLEIPEKETEEKGE
ncbi:MAG: hypothetical protein HUJ59_04405 [Bacilli bacterium]|nr:hypothetical protein [Bacilli bacterium]